VRQTVLQAQLVSGGIRATGREHFPTTGGVLLISNHLSYYDVFVLGVLLPRMLNYVARSTLFTPLLGPLIRSVGGFPIQRDGMGAQGLKETLKRLRGGAVVTFFPEGTRSPSGELGALKPGIATLASRAGVPVVAAGIAGTYQSWPRGRAFPRPHPIRIHYGRPITPDQLDGLSADAVLERLAQELSESVLIAKQALNRDLEVDQSMENRVAT
jgi:1-acyl-sn-glycerol-3-phosphate acyltransferase